VTNRRVGSPIISETANPAATNETYIGEGIFVPRSWQKYVDCARHVAWTAMGDWCETHFSGRIEICSA
jgi:hypothetical protein